MVFRAPGVEAARGALSPCPIAACSRVRAGRTHMSACGAPAPVSAMAVSAKRPAAHRGRVDEVREREQRTGLCPHPHPHPCL